MNSKGTIEFNSRECKHNLHSSCTRKWEGLGFTALCICACHERKVDVSRVWNPVANVILESSSSSEVTKENGLQ
jgi:hypothetical protein